MKPGLWVSSTSRDMDVFVSLRVLDEQDREIRDQSLVPPIDPTNIHPARARLAQGVAPRDR